MSSKKLVSLRGSTLLYFVFTTTRENSHRSPRGTCLLKCPAEKKWGLICGSKEEEEQQQHRDDLILKDHRSQMLKSSLVVTTTFLPSHSRPGKCLKLKSGTLCVYPDCCSSWNWMYWHCMQPLVGIMQCPMFHTHLPGNIMKLA